MDLIKLVANAQKQNATRLVGPTLIIGLGGTGKDVLLRLRRLLVEHYGRLDDLPFLRFLHMDTDQTQEARQQYDIKAEDDPLNELIRFDTRELIDLRIPGGTGNIINNIHAYPNIREWFQTKGRMYNLGDLGRGAGQVRMASRLAFYLNINAIKGAFQTAMGTLLQAGVADQARKLEFSFNPENRNVYVVGSMAGGTGSGVFIDVGFLLKQVLTDFDRLGFFMLPSAFAGYAGENRMKANGYAALMELNHYCFGHAFTGQWDQVEKRTIAPPPYETTYLIDAENAVGTIARPEELYQMIAESLFHEFSLGGFADKKRSVRVNLVQFTQNAYLHSFWDGFDGMSGAAERTLVGDSYTLRFSSFGLSTIALPVDKIFSACACRVGREIIDQWQQQASQSYLEELFTRFLGKQAVNFAQGDINLKDGGRFTARQIEDELFWQNKDAGIDYRQFFWRKVQDLVTRLRALPMKSKADALQTFLADIETWFGRENSDREDEWGQIIRNVADNARQYRVRVQQGIEKECDRLANDPRYGIAHTLALLRELKSVLRSELENIWYIPAFEKGIQEWGALTQNYKYQLDEVAFDLAGHERQFFHRTDDVNRDLQLLCREDGEDQGILYDYLYARISRIVFRWGKEIAESIDAFLGKDDVHGSGLIAKYRILLRSLDEFKDRLGRMETYFKRLQQYSHTKSLLAADEIEASYNRWYNRWVGGNEDTPDFGSQLAKFGNDLLSTVFQAESVTAALDTIRKSSSGVIEYRILKRCRELLQGQADTYGRPSALGHLFGEGMAQSKSDELIRNALDLAKVWLHAPTSLGHIPATALPAAEQGTFYIGLDMNDPFSLEFQKVVERVRGNNDNWELVGLGERSQGAIVFFNELSGIPAFYPRTVTAENGLRQWYRTYFLDPQKLDPNNQDVLHTNKNRFIFSDIIPKTPQQSEQYKYAVRSFALGRILDLLRLTNDEDGLRYGYADDAASWRQVNIIDLGVGEDDAIDFLYQRDQSPEPEKIYLKINQNVQWVIDALLQSKILSVYYLLLEFYNNYVYQPETDRNDVPGLTLKRYLPQYAAIAQEIKRMDKFVADSRLEAYIDQERHYLTKGRRELTEQDYFAVLAPYCRRSGFYVQRGVENVVGGRDTIFKDALVLDRERVLGPLPSRVIPAPGYDWQPFESGGDQRYRRAAPGQGRYAEDQPPGYGGPPPGDPGPRFADAGGPGQGRYVEDQPPGYGGPPPGGPEPRFADAGGPGQGRYVEDQPPGYGGPPPGGPEPRFAAVGGPGQTGTAANDQAGPGPDTVTCPSCGRPVPKAPVCSNCGIAFPAA